MPATLKSNYSKRKGQGSITLYENHFKASGTYYGRLDRYTVDIEELITRIHDRNPGINDLAVVQAASYLKEEILASLTRGEAVNIMDLGTMYLKPVGKFKGDSTSDENIKSSLIVKFTPSTTVKEAVSKADIDIKKVSYADTGIKIASIRDKITDTRNRYITAGKGVTISGEKLKLDDLPSSGIYLCPVRSDSRIVDDEALWTKVTYIESCTPSKILFYVPDDLPLDSDYRILVRSSYSTGKKPLSAPKIAESCVVRAVPLGFTPAPDTDSVVDEDDEPYNTPVTGPVTDNPTR